MKYVIQVSEVKKNEGSLKGFATVTFGESFKVTNIAILEAADGRMFVSMPRYKTNQKDEKGNDFYKDICNPITKEFRGDLYNDIVTSFENRNVEHQVKSENYSLMIKVTASISTYEREGSNMKALARVILDDCFVINNITIIEDKNGKNFVVMPGYKTNQKDEQGKDIYRDICYPVTADFRSKMYAELLDGYQKARTENTECMNSNIVQEKSQHYEDGQKENKR